MLPIPWQPIELMMHIDLLVAASLARILDLLALEKLIQGVLDRRRHVCVPFDMVTGEKLDI